MSTGTPIMEKLSNQALINITTNGSTDSVYRPEGYTACVSKDFVHEYTRLLYEYLMEESGE